MFFFRKSTKITIFYRQLNDNSILSYQKKLSLIGQKIATKRMPKYGIIVILNAILAHNLVKYQYFLMKFSLFEKYYQIKYSLQFSEQYHYHGKCGFYAQKHRKTTKITFSRFAFFRKCASRFG